MANWDEKTLLSDKFLTVTGKDELVKRLKVKIFFFLFWRQILPFVDFLRVFFFFSSCILIENEAYPVFHFNCYNWFQHFFHQIQFLFFFYRLFFGILCFSCEINLFCDKTSNFMLVLIVIWIIFKPNLIQTLKFDHFFFVLVSHSKFELFCHYFLFSKLVKVKIRLNRSNNFWKQKEWLIFWFNWNSIFSFSYWWNSIFSVFLFLEFQKQTNKSKNLHWKHKT